MRVVIELRRDSVCTVSSDLLCLFMWQDLEKENCIRVISLILRFLSAETSKKET